MSPSAQEPGALAQFRGLLEQARNGPGLIMFELDGSHAHAPDAYGAAARLVLNQSDLLIGVWDGGEAAGRGGTLQTLHDAILYHVPVIRIDALAPADWSLLSEEADLEPGREGASIPPVQVGLHAIVARIVQAELGIPHDTATVSHSAEYFAERKPSLNLAFVWKFFRDLMGSGKIAVPALFVPDFESRMEKDWNAERPVSQWVNGRLRAPLCLGRWAGRPLRRRPSQRVHLVLSVVGPGGAHRRSAADGDGRRQAA